MVVFYSVQQKLSVEPQFEPILQIAACCTSAVVQRAARQKMVCARGVPGVTGTLGKANSHFDPTQTEWGTAPPC